jgi:DNA topoisomerase-2
METNIISQQYQKKTEKEHILDKPGMYIGPISKIDEKLYVYDDVEDKIKQKEIKYLAGLYKIFDEIIVNSRDHIIRIISSKLPDKINVTEITVNIKDDGTIEVMNNGDGIDVVEHPEHKLYIPEMILGHLRTSTNYNENEQKLVGGTHGYGAKLTMIWSKFASIETVDNRRGLKYYQEFKNNLDIIVPPVITKSKSKPYTKITFLPDYARFGLPDGLTEDLKSLFKKRVYDIAGVSDHSVKKVKFTYNNTVVPVKNFKQYIEYYIDDKNVYELSNERWEYAVAISPTHEFMQVSFVNGINTIKGGKHVEYILNQITKKMGDYIEKKKKVKVQPNSIKEQLFLFLRCDLQNPSFDSQTKEYMSSPIAKFGSKCEVSDGFIEKLAKLGVMELAIGITDAKENKQAKKTDGVKVKNVRGIANFIDANFAGTEKSKDCILILCEGLSALSGIVSGLSSTDRNIIGIYPLKGKVLNVRGEVLSKISGNKEITELKKILGLENDKEYTLNEVHKKLRYGKVMFLTDADPDGSHIKGLCVNVFDSLWKSLIKINGFISFMNTPILRVQKGTQKLLFYNDGEYTTWKNTQQTNLNSWNIKYLKGLGSSGSVEFKEYFANKKIVEFVYTEQSENTIDKVFNKKRPDERKLWLENYDKDAYLDTNKTEVKYEDFINMELIHFSKYDCERSIPNMVDGLKISLRKVLYCAFKRNLKTEVKVAQFSGYVSEHSNYHHGEASLNGTIINMAQDYMGSNNINLLDPRGQFGSRLSPDSAASERYIFTLLNTITRFIFPELDDPILNYINDDGTPVEPEFYCPIIPMVLINGSAGIGTGFSTNIEPYNPMDVIQFIKNKLRGFENNIEFIPYYEGFKGSVIKIEEKKYKINGVYEKIKEDTIKITELPVGAWTLEYITFLEELLDGKVDKNGKKSQPVIKDFTNLSTEKIIDITVVFPKGKLDELKDEDILKLLKLTTTVSTTNMHLFNQDSKLRKYNKVEDIIEDYYVVRLDAYKTRKEYLLVEMENRLIKISNKAKYINLVLEDKIDLRKKNITQITELLKSFELVEIDGNYNYLIKMTMDSVSIENINKLLKEKGDLEFELNTLKNKTLEEIWLEEIILLEKEYITYKNRRNELTVETPRVVKKTIKMVVKK